jgi:cell division protein FtsL
MQKNMNYMYGSAAPKIDYNVYEENKVLKAKKLYRTNVAMKLKVINISLLVFAACFVLIYRYALISQMNYDVIKAEKELKALTNDNSRIMVQIEKAQDLEKIKQIASTELGMKKPDKMQTVYYKVPKYDVTVVPQNTSSTADKSKSSITSFAAGIKNLMESFQ